MVWIGGLLVVAAFAAIFKHCEPRLVLFLSGLTMATLAGKPGAALGAFEAAMVNGGLAPVICTVMGFVFVMKHTGCDDQLVRCLAGGLKLCRPALIPGTVVVTFLINIALPSAAVCAAAAGSALIPLLIGAGVHPAAAASAVLAGTWGSVLDPGNIHNPFIARLAGVDALTVVRAGAGAAMAGALVVAAAAAAVVRLRGEDGGYVPAGRAAGDGSGEEVVRVNVFKALTPVAPLVLLVIGGRNIGWLPWVVTVPQAMLLGTALGMAAAVKEPQEISRRFFAGMGEAYGDVIGIIIAAAVFTKGMEVIGLTGALIDIMRQSEQLAPLAATFGPLAVAALTGSGDAATLAFNGAVTPYARQFGGEIIPLGVQAFLAGGFGRSMSPVAGAAIVCAALAGVSPVETAKRNAPVMIAAALVTMAVLL